MYDGAARTAPAVNACDDAPDDDAPDDDAPDADAADADPPDVDAPDIDAPAVDAPAVNAPDVNVPDVDAPDVSAPDSDAPGAEGAGVFDRAALACVANGAGVPVDNWLSAWDASPAMAASTEAALPDEALVAALCDAIDAGGVVASAFSAAWICPRTCGACAPPMTASMTLTSGGSGWMSDTPVRADGDDARTAGRGGGDAGSAVVDAWGVAPPSDPGAAPVAGPRGGVARSGGNAPSRRNANGFTVPSDDPCVAFCRSCVGAA